MEWPLLPEKAQESPLKWNPRMNSPSAIKPAFIATQPLSRLPVKRNIFHSVIGHFIVSLGQYRNQALTLCTTRVWLAGNTLSKSAWFGRNGGNNCMDKVRRRNISMKCYYVNASGFPPINNSSQASHVAVARGAWVNTLSLPLNVVRLPQQAQSIKPPSIFNP